MIPVCEPLLSGREEELVLDCLRSGWISSAGKYIDRFEEDWAAYCGMKHGISVSSGTAALQVALDSLSLPPGTEVIMPTFTIVSCALAIVRSGLVPVLVDSNPANWQLDVSQIKKKITVKTSAIMVVHIYGHPVDMQPVLDIADEFDLKIIEDAAEVHGALYKGRKCGGFGDVSVFSFYANKLVTTGEGGMVLTNDNIVADRARSQRNLCFQKKRRFYHDEAGYNFRMTNIQAAIGVAQIKQIEQIVTRKRAIARLYSSLLEGVSGLDLPIEEPWAKSVYWVYGIVLKDDTDVNGMQFVRKLRENGIDSRPFFTGMHEQPVFHKMGLFLDEIYPVAERLSRQGLYLPTGLSISEDEIGWVCETVRKCLT